MTDPICCTPKHLPDYLLVPAAETARGINPTNAPPPLARAVKVSLAGKLDVPARAVMTTKWWGSSGVNLTVGFMDNPTTSLKTKILSHANAWGKRANVRFVETKNNPKIRILRDAGGYWSYLGTDILHVPADEQTMNLEGFTNQTEDAEFFRVVRHEFGHTLGMPHEHMRKQVVALIDQKKAIRYFGATQGWSRQEVIAQVLTPLDESDVILETKPDQMSIMCYQLPGQIMKNGKPILGGSDINDSDYDLCGLVYPIPSSLENLV